MLDDCGGRFGSVDLAQGDVAVHRRGVDLGTVAAVERAGDQLAAGHGRHGGDGRHGGHRGDDGDVAGLLVGGAAGFTGGAGLFLSGLLEHVSQRIAAGDSRETIVALDNLPGFPDFHQPTPNRMAMNLVAAYDELTTTSGR